MDKINTTIRKSYEVKIFIGSIDESCGMSFTEESIVRLIGEFQDSTIHILPVRISKTRFISGVKYDELGWELSSINFPKINCWGRSYKSFMIKYMNELATFLTLKLNQKRVCVVSPNKTYIHENTKFIKV